MSKTVLPHIGVPESAIYSAYQRFDAAPSERRTPLRPQSVMALLYDRYLRVAAVYFVAHLRRSLFTGVADPWSSGHHTAAHGPLPEIAWLLV